MFAHELTHAFHDAIGDMTGGGDKQRNKNCCPYDGREDKVTPVQLQSAWQAEGSVEEFINVDEYFAYLTEAYFTLESDKPLGYCPADDAEEPDTCLPSIGTCSEGDDSEGCMKSCEDILDWGGDHTCEDLDALAPGMSPPLCTGCPSCPMYPVVEAVEGKCWYECDERMHGPCTEAMFNHAGPDTRESIQANRPETYSFLSHIFHLSESELTAYMHSEYGRRWRYAASGSDSSCPEVVFDGDPMDYAWYANEDEAIDEADDDDDDDNAPVASGAARSGAAAAVAGLVVALVV